MKSENFEAMGEQTKSKKMPKVLIGVIIAVLLILVMAASVMAANYKPETIFKKQVDKLITYENQASHKTVKMNMDLQMNVEGKGEVQEVENLLNDIKLSFAVERNHETQEERYAIKLKKQEEELINAKAKLDAESKKAYVNLGEFFDKTIEMDASELLESVSEESLQSLNFMQLLNAKKAESILKKEIKDQLKMEYFSSEKTTINGENLTKNILKMTGKELKDAVKNVCQNLARNEEFITCFEDGEELKVMLEELAYEVETCEIPDDAYFEMDLYTNGILPKIKRIDIVITEDGEEVAIQLTGNTKEEYSYSLLSNESEIIKGKVIVKGTENDSEIEVTAEAEGIIVTVKLDSKVVYDEELSEFDNSQVVKSEELTMEDMMKLYNNFLESRLYDVIEEIMSDVEPLPESSVSGTSTSNLDVNTLKTYHDEIIKFKIPNGFEAYSSSSDSYKLFEKKQGDDTIDVKVSVAYGTNDDYMEDIKQMAEYFNSEDYSNIEISKPQEIQVNGKKFQTVTLSYDYKLFDEEIVNRKEIYYAYEIDDENLYAVEIEGAELMSQSEMDAFLTIE